MIFRFCNIVMILLIIALQVRLWSDEGGIPQIWNLEEKIDQQKEKNSELERRNNELYAQIDNLKDGSDEMEGRARKNLGMIKEGETFFLIVDTKNKLIEDQR